MIASVTLGKARKKKADSVQLQQNAYIAKIAFRSAFCSIKPAESSWSLRGVGGQHQRNQWVCAHLVFFHGVHGVGEAPTAFLHFKTFFAGAPSPVVRTRDTEQPMVDRTTQPYKHKQAAALASLVSENQDAATCRPTTKLVN